MSGNSSANSTTAAAPRKAHLPTVGSFKAVRVLGEGGMGIVYLAEQDRPLRRQVALKVVRAGLSTKQIVARFERERQALAMMNHPHVSRVYDAGETEDGRPYFAMEYVEGVPVTKYCDAQKLGNRERLNIFLKVCDALQHAHQKGIIHRDIKPSNILVSGTREQPVPKVIDFGIAKAIGQRLTGDTFTTQFGQFVGTPAYMSPEQANPYADDVDTRTDVYSLGVLLYELLAGVLPFDFTQALEKGSIADVQRLILEQEPELPSSRISSLGADSTTVAENHGTEVHRLRRELRGDLDWIVMRALEKDRARRYATVLDLQRDVERHLKSEPVSAGPPTLRYRAAKFLRRRRVAVVLGVMGLALAATGTIAGLSARKARLVHEDFLRETTQRIFFEAQLAAMSRPEDAIAKLRQLGEQHPDYLEPRIQLAYLLQRESRAQECIAVAEKILEDAPQTGAIHLLLAQVYRARHTELAKYHLEKGRELLPNDRYYRALASPEEESAEAIALLDQVLQTDGANFDARWQRAYRYLRMERYDDMLRDAEVLTEIRPTSPSAWNIHGRALTLLERGQEAVVSYSRALELEPRSAPLYAYRCDLYRALGESNLARRDCNKALSLDPNLAYAYAARARIEYESSNLDRALSDCERALSHDPQNVLGLWNRGATRWRLKEYTAAVADLTAACTIEPRNMGIILDRARVFFDLQDYQAAAADYDRAMVWKPAMDEALFRAGLCYQYLGEFDKALERFDKAIGLTPDAAHLYHVRARLHRWAGNCDLALADHEKALGLSAGEPDPLIGFAITRWQCADLEGAKAQLKEGVERLPDENRAMGLAWLWHIQMLGGDHATAAETILAAQASAKEPLDARVIAMLRGLDSFEDVLSAAATPTEQASVLYYAGVAASLTNEHQKARSLFARCREAKVMKALEYDFALMQLTQYFPCDTWP